MRSSIPCPYCGNDLWDVIGDQAECSNCGYTRPYYRRKGHSGNITPSQEKKIDFIRDWFKRYFRKEDLARFDVTFQKDTGFVYVAVETTKHPLTTDGAMLMIRRRGGIKVIATYGLSNVHDEKFYQSFLRR